MIKHLAITMDGNRRWARKNNMESYLGHYQGAKTIQKAVDFCLDKKILNLSLYSFSLENFNRTEEEKNYIFNLLVQETEKNLKEAIQKGIRIKFIGDRSRFPEAVVDSCKKLEEETKPYSNLILNFHFCYGSRQEMVAGVKQVANEIVLNKISLDDITEELFSKFLWTNEIPEPDIIVRTGGQKRLSNFLLFQSAYSELYFLDLMWPEIEVTHFNEIFNDFALRKRNFGV